jgi:ABC-type polysaccharide/polyol phosphate transport system ATPase subunit
MTTDPTIRFADVSKRFKLNAEQADSVLDTIISSFSHSRTAKKDDRELWAVQKTSFDIMPGECVGFVGRNGSGKSTMLKLISGIIRPTTGIIQITGRLSALLELGAGFHPDLTGRENISLNASILGLSNAEVAEIYDEIVEFSELSDFLNMPVKYYSSGMYMRLGFSVAVHVQPDVLLIDEILAVGDQSFQEKCIDRLHQLRDEGRTVLFVSHNLETVRSLCSRILWIEKGSLIADGPSEEVLQEYLESYNKQDLEEGEAFILPSRWGSGEVEITNLRLLNAAGEENSEFVTGEAVTIELAYKANEPVEKPEFILSIHRDDVATDEPDSQLVNSQPGELAGPGVVRCHIDSLPFPPALYHISAGVYGREAKTTFDYHERVKSLQVVADPERKGRGYLDIPAKWDSGQNELTTTVEASVIKRKLVDVD